MDNCDLWFVFFPYLRDSLNLIHSFKLRIFVLCLYFMCNAFKIYYQSYSSSMKERRLFRPYELLFYKQRQSYCDFGRNCFYVMISTDVLSESLQTGCIIMMCEVPQLRCDSFPHRHIVFNFYNKVYWKMHWLERSTSLPQ